MSEDSLDDLLAIPPKRTFPNPQLLWWEREPEAVAFRIPLPDKPNVGPTMKFEGREYRVAKWSWEPYHRPSIGSDGVAYAGEAAISLEAMPKG